MKSTSGPVAQSALLRYGFWTLWFLVVPAAIALSLVAWLQSTEGPLAQIGAQVRDQSVPVAILLFTFAEMGIYGLRHSLPYAEMLGHASRAGVPKDSIRAFEAAGQLCAETDRILERNGKAVAREVSKVNFERVTRALAQLRQTMDAQPFEPGRFQEQFDIAHRLVDEHLAPWRKSETRELVESVGVAVLVALTLRAVVVEAFKIPSGSMLPTLQIDDHIFVNKFTYGPKVPFLGSRVGEQMPPERGDVIVFEFPDPAPGQEGQDFIKRVIAMPGDTLEVRHGQPIVNGWKVPRCRVGQYPFRQNDGNASEMGELYVEFLADESYLTVYDGSGSPAYEGPFHVPANEIYVMGDNRNNSLDSRKWRSGKGGGVPYANIQGRAMRVWWPPSRLLVPVMGHPELPTGLSPALTEGIERCLAQRPSDTVPPAAARAATP